jgi:cell division protein FtsI/penicillin-binding protein 2
VGGKTGTAENPHGEDHAWFVGFAPFDDPKIAVACIIENAGFGGTKAAPICGQIMQRYLMGEQVPAAGSTPVTALREMAGSNEPTRMAQRNR